MKIKDFIRPSLWIKEHRALTADGTPTFATSESAVKWDLIGFILRFYNDEPMKAVRLVINHVREKYPDLTVDQFNDLPETKYYDIQKIILDLGL